MFKDFQIFILVWRLRQKHTVRNSFCNSIKSTPHKIAMLIARNKNPIRLFMTLFLTEFLSAYSHNLTMMNFSRQMALSLFLSSKGINSAFTKIYSYNPVERVNSTINSIFFVVWKIVHCNLKNERQQDWHAMKLVKVNKEAIKELRFWKNS